MKKAKVFSAFVKGTAMQVKAYKKVNAVERLRQFDHNIKSSDVKVLPGVQNSHQGCVEDLYPEICQ